MCEYAFEKMKEFKYGTGKSLFCWPGPAPALQQSQSGEWAPTAPHYSRMSNGARSKELIFWDR